MNLLRNCLPFLKKNRRFILSALVMIGVLLFFYSSMRFTLEGFGGNYSGFLRLRDRRANRVPFLTQELKRNLILKDKSGYDGQWFYYMAFDPFLSQFKDQPQKYHDVVDEPAYRYGRIGLPLIVNIFSGGNSERFPATTICTILVFIIVGAFFFVRILLFYQRSPLWGFLYILVPGFWTSLNVGLPEPIASALLLGGFYFYLREKFVASTFCFSYSILTRETGILLVLGITIFDLFFRRRTRAGIIIGCSVVPYFVWRLFLTWRLFDDYGWQTLLYSPGDFTIPLRGIFDLYATKELGPMISGLYFYPVFILINLLFSLALVRRRKEIPALALLGYSLLYASLNYAKIWGHIRDVERISNEGWLFLVIASLSLSKDSPDWLKYGFLGSFALLTVYDAFFSSFTLNFQSLFSTAGGYLPGF